MASRAGGPVRVLRRDFGAARALADSGDWQRVETELATFGERFEVFARDPLDAMRVMTPLMIEGIYYLDGKLDVPLAFHFENGEMLVFMALTRDAFDVSGKKTLLEERKLLEEDISLITGFLDTMYFKRGEKSTAAEEKRENTGEAVALAAAAGVAGFSLAARLSRLGMGLHGPMRLACKLVFWLPAAIWGISVVVAFLNLPDGVALSFSITDGATELSDPCNTLAFIAVGAIFVLPSALLVGNILGKTLNVFFLGAGQGVSYGGRILQLFKSFVAALFAGIPLWLHLLFISINLDALQAI
ncbi:DUF3137 domain-containing protein [Desulfovibrio sp. SGI.169]|uniref:DUF3137 domain-containing protein n=1 Tax=Desulfovibrio sp. SGI.169 TaxID=3420561 RepID=UPI003D04D386